MKIIDNLSCTEQDAIEELRERVKSCLKPQFGDDNFTLYRFLKARDFDVDKAEAMLRKHFTWRKAFQVDKISEVLRPSEFIIKYLRGNLVGFDKDGCIMRYIATGNIDIKDVVKCCKMSDYMKHCVWFAEQDQKLLRQENERTGKNASQVSIIFDLKGLTFSTVTNKASTDLFLKLTQLNQDNYPERMKATYIINAPAYFMLVYSVVKRIMSGAMIQKIHVFGQNGWKEALLKQFDAAELPEFLGGTKTDPDGNPDCNSFIFHGGKVPAKYYMSEEERTFKDWSKVQKLFIPQMSKREVTVEVTEPGTRIEWVFETVSKDIGFGLFYQGAAEDREEVLPILKFDTSDGTEMCSYKCPQAGTYVLVFDNTYSWMISKEVNYCIDLVKPEA